MYIMYDLVPKESTTVSTCEEVVAERLCFQC